MESTSLKILKWTLIVGPVRGRCQCFGAPFAPQPPAATLPGLACIGSLGERAFGCGRWASALTEPSRSYVRSLTRAPLARSVLLRLVLLRDPAQPCAQERE